MKNSRQSRVWAFRPPLRWRGWAVTFVVTTGFLLSCSSNGTAQSEATDVPSGGTPEVVLVFISTSGCSGNAEPRLDEAIRRGKDALRTRLAESGATFATIGAAAEPSVSDGLAYLMNGVSPGYSTKDWGPWDEVWAGRNWLNQASLQYIWRDRGRATVPQLVVVRRTIIANATGYEVGPDQILTRIVGSKEIVAWFDSGMPIEAYPAG